MKALGRYRAPHIPPPPKPQVDRFLEASIRANLRALVAAGVVALGLLVAAFALEWLLTRHRPSGYTAGTFWNLGLGAVVVFAAWLLLHFDYDGLRKGHGVAASILFVLLGLAAGVNAVVTLLGSRSHRWLFAVLYGAIGAAMISIDITYYLATARNWFADASQLVLYVEVAEIALFVAYWLVQTVDRWGSIDGSEPAPLT
jgi:hypothetical protein